ncbi:MAG: enoyl-CoA hydratase/isomerase family protein [Desulfomonilaceae bacterium]|nr:enoyl-CoA hydratase/isomerase family protein [Desulfomonilaceae bacterium]
MDSTGISIRRTGRVAVVRFDRSDDLNALSLDLMGQLTETALSFQEDAETSAVVLTGGSKAFCAGIDLRDPQLIGSFLQPVGRRRQALAIGPKMCRAWESMDQVTICAIEGHCIGGGLALAAACDFRIMGRGARCRIPELSLGMNLSWQTLPRLVHLVGPARAKQIVILAEEVSAEQAHIWGLAEEVVENGKAMEAAIAMAEKVARMPPIPVRMTKQAVNAVTNALDHATAYMDLDQLMLCLTTADHREGLEAFLTKREPTFKGE